MRITVLLFAGAKDLAGTSEVTLNLADSSTVADAKRNLASKYKQLETMLSVCSFAIDEKYVSDNSQLDDNCCLACIPPVSGG